MNANILFVVNNLEVNGTALQTGLLARALLPTEYKPHILTVGPAGELAEPLGKSGIPVDSLHAESTLSFGVCRGVRRICEAWDIDIVQSMLSGDDLAIVRGARAAGVIGVITSRRRMPEAISGLARKAQRWSNDRVDRILCNSNAVREACRAMEGVPEAKWVTIPNGFPEAGFPDRVLVQTPPIDRPLLRSRMIDPGEVVLGCVGNFTPEKNPFKLIDAFRNVLLDGSRARLVLIGEGPLQEEVRSYVESKSLREGVIFLGKRLDRLKILPECQALVQPSRGEGFSNAILEAQALGIPVIASRDGGNLELVEHGVTGWTFPPEDELEMAAAMRKVLFDPEAAIECARRAQERTRKAYTDRHLLANHLNLYRELMKTVQG